MTFGAERKKEFMGHKIGRLQSGKLRSNHKTKTEYTQRGILAHVSLCFNTFLANKQMQERIFLY